MCSTRVCAHTRNSQHGRQVRDTHRQPISSTALMSSGSTPSSSKADMLVPGQLLLERLAANEGYPHSTRHGL